MAEIRVKETGTIKLFESDNTSSVTIASPASLGADRTITLPDASVTLASGSNTLTVDITPAATTSKMWVVVSATGGHATTNGSVGFFTVFRDSTDLGAASDKGLGENYGGSSDIRTFIGFSILDSPSTTSQITYQVYFRDDGSSGQVDLNWNGTKGTITVFELGV